MRIAIIVEGETEKAFLPALREFLEKRLAGNMPRLHPIPQQGRVPKETKLQRVVQNLLKDHEAVIALTDVYTGTTDFTTAQDAKEKMRQWVGNEPRFFPHAAQHDFEAWLLPFWEDITKLAGHVKKPPSGVPEAVNHGNPPAYRLEELFKLGGRNKYNKPREAQRILRGKDLTVAADACPELKAFLNTILELCGGEPLK